MFVRPDLFYWRQHFDVSGVGEQAPALLSVRARQGIAIDHAYDVLDVRTNERVGTLVKKGLKSIVRDRFEVLDPSGTRSAPWKRRAIRSAAASPTLAG